MKRRRTTPFERAVILEMRRMGCTYETIGNAVEITPVNAFHVCKKAGVIPVASSVPKPTAFRRRNGRSENMARKQKTYTHTNALMPQSRLMGRR